MFVTFNEDKFKLTLFFNENITSIYLQRHRSSKYRLENRYHADKNKAPILKQSYFKFVQD